MAIALPRIAVGIPIPDCNFSTPRAPGSTARGSAGWAAGGADTSLGTVMMHPGRGNAVDSDPHGTGSSMRVSFEDDHVGTWTSSPSPWGMVPVNPNAAQFVRTIFVIRHAAALTGGAQANWKMTQYDEDGIATGSTWDIFTTSNEFTSAWVTAVFDVSNQWEADTRYVRIISDHASSSTSGGWYGVDFVGLGFVSTPLSDLEEFGKFYNADGGLDHSFSSGLRSSRLPYGGFSRHVRTDTGQARASLDMVFSGLSQAGRDQLLYYWRANKGTPTGFNNANLASFPVLGGHAWPVLIAPGRTGIKGGLYAQFLGDGFPLRIDTSLGWIPEAMLWAGRLSLEEELF